jgi:hypothetical protein
MQKNIGEPILYVLLFINVFAVQDSKLKIEWN